MGVQFDVVEGGWDLALIEEALELIEFEFGVVQQSLSDVGGDGGGYYSGIAAGSSQG